MKKQHWVGVLVLFLIGYAAGVLYPGPGAKVKAKIAGVAA